MLKLFLLLPLLLQWSIPLHTGTQSSTSGGGGGTSTAISYVSSVHSLEYSTSPTSTTATLNVALGDTLVAFCSTSGGLNTITISDSAGNTWTKGTHQNDGTVGNTDLAYSTVSVASTTDSFTCDNSTSSTVNGLIVLQFQGGSSGAPFSLQNTTSSGGWTTASFSTTDPNSVVVQCLSTSSTLSGPGTIGGVTAALVFDYVSSSYDSGCQYVIFNSSQTNITAAISDGGGTNNGQMGAFK